MKLETITPRQFSLYMQFVTTADPAKVIGQQRGMATATVRCHVKKTCKMMGVHSRLELMSQYHSRERGK